MAFQPFRKVRSQDKDLRLVQDAIETPLRDIQSRKILDGQLLENIPISSTLSVNKIPHGLSKPLTGWIVVRQSASATIWDSQGDNENPNLFLNLNTTASCVVSLWVF